MKLKTLKDYSNLEGSSCLEDGIPVIETEWLRVEAIKHIKELEKKLMDLSLQGVWDKTKDQEKMRLLNEKFHTTQGGIDWIKYFFNITKEELK